MNIDVKRMHFKELNSLIRNSEITNFKLDSVVGQKFIGCGLKNKQIEINGVPGNALGACLNSNSKIVVHNDCQDATGDTMNDGEIIIHGNCGDTAGYAMRGGKILIKESAGYRIGLHMKSYQDKQPIIIIGDKVGSFLGEYIAGGTIIVLGLRQEGKCPVGNFCGTGMYGGRIYIKSDELPKDLPPQICANKATKSDMVLVNKEILNFCKIFDLDQEEVFKGNFYVLTPNSKSPYKRLYTSI